MRFIKLTELHTGREIVINFEHVEAFKPEQEGCKLIMPKDIWLVKEDIGEINQMVGLPRKVAVQDTQSLVRAYEESLRRGE